MWDCPELAWELLNPFGTARLLDCHLNIFESYTLTPSQALKPDHPRVGMRAEWPQDDDEAIQHWKLQKANEKFERTHNLRLDAVPGLFFSSY